MRKIYCLFICCMLILCSAQSLFAASLAHELEKRYQSVTSLQANFVQRLVHLDSGAEETRNGMLVFQRPNNIYWEIEAPNSELIVLNNTALWNYLPKDKTVTKYRPEVSPETRMLLDVLTGQSALTTNFSITEIGRENGLVQLRLMPHEPSTQLTEAALWVDTQEKLVKKVQITDFYGNINEVRFVNLKINPAIKAGQFSFSPPKGVTVIDKSANNEEPGNLMR